MITYRYRAVSAGGRRVRGTVCAQNAEEALRQIRRRYPKVESLTVAEGAHGVSFSFTHRPVRAKQLSVMCSRFSMILGSGTSMLHALELIAGQTTDRTLKKILLSVKEDVSAGSTLTKAFSVFIPTIPVLFTETIAAGEESGTLQRTFLQLAGYYEKAEETHRKVVSALIYPLFLLAVAVVVGLVVLLAAVPAFLRTFESMGVALPMSTRMLIAVYHFTENHAVLLFLLMLFFALAGGFIKRSTRGKAFLSKASLHLPLVGRMTILRSYTLFASTMATLMDAGISVEKAISITAPMIGNTVIAAELRSAAAGVLQGFSISECFRRCRTAPSLLYEMVGVGERTGTLSDAMRVADHYYSSEMSAFFSRVTALLEPIMTLLVSILIIWMLLSVYMPLFTMYGSISI